jgi:hypothetical protein
MLSGELEVLGSRYVTRQDQGLMIGRAALLIA